MVRAGKAMGSRLFRAHVETYNPDSHKSVIAKSFCLAYILNQMSWIFFHSMHASSSSLILVVTLPTSMNTKNGSCFLKRNCTRGLYALNFEQKEVKQMLSTLKMLLLRVISQHMITNIINFPRDHSVNQRTD